MRMPRLARVVVPGVPHHVNVGTAACRRSCVTRTTSKAIRCFTASSRCSCSRICQRPTVGPTTCIWLKWIVAGSTLASNASVQVMLFADRLEVWNPGELRPGLTLAQLRRPHASIAHNPLIAEPMFLTRYAEKAGSGILDMLQLCSEEGLPEPEFRQDGGAVRPDDVASLPAHSGTGATNYRRS